MKIAWKRFYCTSKKTVTIVFIALLITNTFDNFSHHDIYVTKLKTTKNGFAILSNAFT